MNYIERASYLDRLSGLAGTPDIKVITGIRRSGKSELMLAFMRRLRASDADANIVYIDFVNLDFEYLKDYTKLNTYLKENVRPGVRNYLFIDEVQLCPKFELVINSIYRERLYDIYLTGSNAFLLSSDLATLFTGRVIPISVFPFSFAEYCQYYEKETPDQLFESYLVKGGMAGSYEYEREQDRIAYLRTVYEAIIQRDLKYKRKLPENRILTHLAEYLMDNVSNITSSNNVAKKLVADGYDTTHVTIGNYMKYLCSAFLFYCVTRYDLRGNKYLETLEKYYLVDQGFRFAELGMRNPDYGRIYENVVAIELLRRGYEIYVGKLYQKEVDFVAIRGDEHLYIQVAQTLEDEAVLKRESAPLLAIRDGYPKLILARTRHPEYQYEGIRVVDIVSWLLDTEQPLR